MRLKHAFKKWVTRAEPFRQEADKVMDEKYPEGWQREKTNSLKQMEHSKIMWNLYKKSKK
jgi:hypothetical protein